MPTLKGFACKIRGCDGEDIVHATSAGKARYRFLLRVRDCYEDATFADLIVRRSNVNDIEFPEIPPVNNHLDERDRDIVLHAFGGGSDKRPADYGYRNYYCTSPTDERLLRLASMGIFTWPHGVDASGTTPGWVGAFFYLSESGKELARGLIGARECAAALKETEGA